MRKQVLSFTVEPELIDYVQKMAQMEHISVSQYIRNLIWTGYELQEVVEDEKQQEELKEFTKKLKF